VKGKARVNRVKYDSGKEIEAAAAEKRPVFLLKLTSGRRTLDILHIAPNPKKGYNQMGY